MPCGTIKLHQDTCKGEGAGHSLQEQQRGRIHLSSIAVILKKPCKMHVKGGCMPLSCGSDPET